MSDKTTRTPTVADHSGRNVVLVVYVAVVIFAGFWGYLLGTIGIKDLRSVQLLFLVEIPPTPVGLAVYGMVTLAVGLGLVLLLVRYASRRYTT